MILVFKVPQALKVFKVPQDRLEHKAQLALKAILEPLDLKVLLAPKAFKDLKETLEQACL